MSPLTVFSLVLVIASAVIAENSAKSESQQQPPAPRVVDFKTPDGVVLKGTCFAAAKPGPGVILYHQNNRTRESWSDVARKLAAVGINVLTVDSRAHGESGGKSENRGGDARKTLWPQDLDAAFEALVSQPCVDRNAVGIGGAGALGVDNSVETARRHPEIKSLMLISGETLLPQVQFLRQSSQSDSAGALRPLHGGFWTRLQQYPSPDPAIRYHWRTPPKGDADLQVLQLRPKAIKILPSETKATEQLLADSIDLNGMQSVFLDFGTECAGWISFESNRDVRSSLTVSVSEYSLPGRVNSGPRQPEKTVVPMRRGGVWVAAMNDELYEGVRFAWINVERQPASPLMLRKIRLNCRVKPVIYKGSFQSSDPLVDRIWYTGAYTARLMMQQHSLSALLMDRGDRISWTGDAFVTQRTVLSAFGSADLVKANLELNRANSNGIEPYALLWIQSVVDYFMYTGDTATFREFLPDVLAKLRHAEDIWDDPDIFFYGHDERLGFLQNPPANLPEEKNAYRLLVIGKLRQVAEAESKAGQDIDAGALLWRAQDLENRFFERNPGWTSLLGLHAAAEAVLAKVGSNADRRKLVDRVFDNPAERISFSPFNEYTLTQALAQAGHRDYAVSDLKTLWGAQIQYGATCFAEVFRPSWAIDLPRNGRIPDSVTGYTSLCHGWSGGVAPWMQEYVLGVQPTSPAFRTFDVAPMLVAGPERFSGDMPTPKGVVHVSWSRHTKRLSLRWPHGDQCRLLLPKGLSVQGSVRQTATKDSDPDDMAAFSPLDSSEDSLDIQVDGFAQILSRKQQSGGWPVNIHIDAKQPQGDWKGVYGQEGYKFLGLSYPSDRLPSYVRGITVHSPGSVIWSPQTEDPRALQFPDKEGRALGAISTRQPYWDKLTAAVDVQLGDDTTHRVTLYFVDWELDDRELEISVYALKDATPIARSLILHHFGNGTYVSFDVRSSFRVRIAHLTGGDAVLSAIFFDPT